MLDMERYYSESYPPSLWEPPAAPTHGGTPAADKPKPKKAKPDVVVIEDADDGDETSEEEDG